MRRLILALTVLAAVSAAKKSYYHPEINTTITLQPDGSAHVVQERVFLFSGQFSFAYVDLLRRGSDRILFGNVYERVGNKLISTGARITPTDSSLYVEWRYAAKDEARAFVLDYTIKGAVKRHADVAEFYWKVIEERHARVVATRTEVILPGPSPSLFKTYVHLNAPGGKLESSPDFSRVEARTGTVPKDVFLEFRVLAEPGLFTAVRASDEPAYERILGEEKRNFLLWTVRKLALIPLGLLLIVVVPLVLVIAFYHRYGREPKVQYDAVYEHEPPRRVPPLAVAAVMTQKPDKSTILRQTPRGLFATVLDLCRQRVCSVQEDRSRGKPKYRFVLEQPDKVEALEPFSRSVSLFLFNTVTGGGTTLTDEELQKYIKSHPHGVQQMLESLDARGVSWWRKELGTGFLDPESEKAYRRFMFLLVGLLVPGAAAIGMGVSTVAPSSGPGSWIIGTIAALVCGLVYAGFGRTILRWNETAYLEHLRWRKFRKFLAEFSALEQAPVSLLGIWEQYYVYAVALGVARQFLSNVQRLAAERGTVLVLPAWYAATAAGGTAQVGSLADFGSFASNFSGMVSSFTTTSSSGGGFSGGGGGGGGGGSSGAG